MVGSAVTADVHAVTHEAMWMVVGAAAQVDDAGSERLAARIALGAAAVVVVTDTGAARHQADCRLGSHRDTAGGAETAVSRVAGAAVTVDVTAVVQAAG